MAKPCCAEWNCVAVVEVVGEKCPIHQKASQGPYASPCERCGKPITNKELWVRARRPDRPADMVEYPWHWPTCQPGRRLVVKPKKKNKNWEKNLGLYEESDPFAHDALRALKAKLEATR